MNHDDPAAADAHDDLVEHLVNAGDAALPDGFRRHTVTIRCGAGLDYAAFDWTDALVLIREGAVDIEGVSGRRYRFERDAILHLTDLPIRAVHNVGSSPAVITAITRRTLDDAGSTPVHMPPQHCASPRDVPRKPSRHR